MAVGVAPRRRTTNGIPELGAMRVTQPRAGRLGRRTGVGASALSSSAAGLVALRTRVGTSFRSDPPAAVQPTARTAAAALGPQVTPSFRSPPPPFQSRSTLRPRGRGTAMAAPLRLCGPGLGQTVPPRRCPPPPVGRAGKLPIAIRMTGSLFSVSDGFDVPRIMRLLARQSVVKKVED